MNSLYTTAAVISRITVRALLFQKVIGISERCDFGAFSALGCLGLKLFCWSLCAQNNTLLLLVFSSLNLPLIRSEIPPKLRVPVLQDNTIIRSNLILLFCFTVG
jgi:hypothetical protein